MKFTIMRTNIAMPDEAGLAQARRLLFDCLEGFGGEAARKAWHRFWGHIVKMQPGELVSVEMTFTRNPKFHRRFFALLTVGFEAWEPGLQHQGQEVVKNFDRFREDVLILGGFYDTTVALDGSLVLRARSISFSSMDDAEFEQVYSAVIDVLLRQVLTTYTRADLDRVIDELMRFDG